MHSADGHKDRQPHTEQAATPGAGAVQGRVQNDAALFAAAGFRWVWEHGMLAVLHSGGAQVGQAAHHIAQLRLGK